MFRNFTIGTIFQSDKKLYFSDICSNNIYLIFSSDVDQNAVIENKTPRNDLAMKKKRLQNVPPHTHTQGTKRQNDVVLTSISSRRHFDLCARLY